MAYCSNCGAYIPDGETKCVACGHVVGASDAAQAVQQAPGALNDDALREEYEKKQEEIKNQSEQWAQQAGVQHSGSSTSQNTGGTPTASKPAESGYADYRDQRRSRIFAGLSYVGIFCLLPFFFCPQDDFARFHAKQGVVLFVLSLVIDLFSQMSGIAAILNVARLFFMIKGILNVSKGLKEPLPYIGQLADKF